VITNDPLGTQIQKLGKRIAAEQGPPLASRWREVAGSGCRPSTRAPILRYRALDPKPDGLLAQRLLTALEPRGPQVPSLKPRARRGPTGSRSRRSRRRTGASGSGEAGRASARGPIRFTDSRVLSGATGVAPGPEMRRSTWLARLSWGLMAPRRPTKPSGRRPTWQAARARDSTW
jgi:hypothetical protein